MAMKLSSPSAQRRGRGGGRAPVSEINVTPLVDVMLVLLIIFMVTAPMLTAGVPVELPQSAADSLPTSDEPVEISIGTDGQVYIGEEAVADADLRGRFMQLAALEVNGSPRQVNLRGDTALQYGRIMQVMGEMNAAGLRKIGLVTLGSSEGQ